MALDNFRRIDMQINRANDYQIETQFAKEGDYNGRELVVQITDAGEVSNQNGVSLNLGWKHNSAGNSGLDPFTVVDASKGIFKITYPTEMLIAGDVTASIQALESGKITLTRNFKITVENNPIDESAIVSENSFTALQEALVRVNDLEDNYAPRLNEVTTQLAQIGVNVKTFGAIGDGVTDDTEAIKNGINYAIENKLALFMPPGIFMIRPGVLEIDVYDNLYIHGVGELSQIKVFDTLNNSKWANMFHFKTTEDVDKIEIKNLYVNQNASGSEPPTNSYDYEQAHAFRVNVSETKTLKEIMFENVRINDPMADGFNNSGVGNVDIYKVLNCKVTNRTRSRSDIQFSRTPSEVIINYFQGDVIESETLFATKTNIRIDNTTVNRVDGAPGKLGTIYMNNTAVKEGAYFGECKVIINNSELSIRQSNLRWNRLVFGSKITNSTIYLPYNPTENSVGALDLRSYANLDYEQGITFENCEFLIDSDDDTITPSGYLIDDQAVVPLSEEKKPSKKFVNCFFDTRAENNIRIHRSGNWYFDKCSFSGKNESIRLATGYDYHVDVHINDADYSNVEGYALVFESYSIVDGHLYINLYMTGYAKGEKSTNFKIISSNINRLVSERTLIDHSGSGGIKGDRKSSNSVDYIGKVATTSSPTNAIWKNYGSIAP